MKTIVFLGYSGGGKTRAIVSIVRELVKAGRKVGTLKSIHDEDFTIDTKGKDTWRHAAAGASVVVALAPKELTTIEKIDTTNMALDQLLGLFERRGIDYLVVEGLHSKLSRRRGVVRILCARSNEEAAELLKMHPRPICILNRKPRKDKFFQGLPLLHLPADMKRLMNLVTSSSD